MIVNLINKNSYKISVCLNMAENKTFEENFHHTRPVEMYDDLNSASFAVNSIEKQPQQNPFLPEVSAPPLPGPINRSQVYGQMITPKSYDGKTNPRIWLNHYETVSEANLWNNDLKLRRVIGSLDGPALQWYMNLRMSNQITEWNQFKEAVINRFTNTMQDIMLTENIINSRQKNNDFDSYWEHKLGLIKLTNPGMSEKDLMNHLFNGLNRELKAKVADKLIVRKCETASELQKLVKDMIDTQDNYQTEDNGRYQKKYKYHSNAFVDVKPNRRYWTPHIDRSPIRNDNTGERNHRSFTPGFRKENSFHKMKKLEKELDTIKEKLEDTNNGERRKNKTFETNKKNNDWKNNIICFNCHKKGHFAKECKEKSEENEKPKPKPRSKAYKPGNEKKTDNNGSAVQSA